MKYLVTITVSRTEINTKHIFKIACTLLDDDHACYLIDTDRVIPMIGLTSLPCEHMHVLGPSSEIVQLATWTRAFQPGSYLDVLHASR